MNPRSLRKTFLGCRRFTENFSVLYKGQKNNLQLQVFFFFFKSLKQQNLLISQLLWVKNSELQVF